MPTVEKKNGLLSSM